MKAPEGSRRAALAAAALSSSWLIVELIRGGIPWTPAWLLSLSSLWVLSEEPGGLGRGREGWAIFLATLALYLSTFRWRGGDDIPNSILPLAILRHGTLALDSVIDPWLSGKAENFTLQFSGRTLNIFSVVPGVLATPVYVLPVLAKAAISEQFLHNLAKISASLITAASAAAFQRGVSRICSRSWALSLTAFYALGTFAFSVSSQALWEHGPAQLGLALGLWGLSEDGWRWDILAGFGFGLAVAARLDSAFMASAAGFFLLFQERRRFAGFILGALIPLALLASYWVHYTGRLEPPELGYHARIFSGLQPGALLALAASPTRGLLCFSPVAAFGLLSLRQGRRSLAPWLLAACAADFLLIAHYKGWSGGMSFGSRYLASVALALVYLCAYVEDIMRRRPALLFAFCGGGAFSIMVQALGAYLNWPGSFRFDVQQAQAWRWRLHPLAQVFLAEGSLGRWPAAARWLAGLAAFLATAALAAALKSYLTRREVSWKPAQARA